MWSWIKRLFKKKQKQVVIVPTIATPSGGKKVIAFVVGHNARAQGAENYNGDSEFKIGRQIFKECYKRIDHEKFELVELIRPSGGYNSQCKHIARELKRIGADFSFHSHFDSASGCPVGSTTLYASYMTLKKEFHDLLTSKLGLKSRGARKATNGFQMLNMTPCPSMIFEWCFGNHKHADSEKVFNNLDLCGKALAETIGQVFN